MTAPTFPLTPRHEPLAVLAAIVALMGCDAPRTEMATAQPPEPPATYVKPPASHPAATELRSAHNPDLVPDDFRELWDDAVGRSPTSQHGDFFYHVAAKGDRAVAVLVPWDGRTDSPLLMGHRTHAVEEAFAVDLSRVPRLSERQITTAYGSAFAFDAFGYTYNVVRRRTARQPARDRPESSTLLVWREALAALGQAKSRSAASGSQDHDGQHRYR